MAYPTAQGVTTHSATYTPEIWSGKTLVKFYKTTVFGDIANTDYEGEIKDMGDTVHIRTIPDITIRDYTAGQKLVRERPNPGVVDLLIDKGHYYSIVINDVQKLQSDIAYVEKWTDDAGTQLKINVDSTILADIYGDAHASNAGLTAGADSSAYNLGVSGTPLAVTKATILDSIVDLGSTLDEQSVPETDRWLLLPPVFCGLIKKSDLKDASLSGDGTSVMRNGRLGMIDRFTIYSTRQLATSSSGGHTAHECMAGHPSALTFAAQLTKDRTIPNPDDFGDLMEGLMVYGYKVIKSEALCHFHAYKA